MSRAAKGKIHESLDQPGRGRSSPERQSPDPVTSTLARVPPAQWHAARHGPAIGSSQQPETAMNSTHPVRRRRARRSAGSHPRHRRVPVADRASAATPARSSISRYEVQLALSTIVAPGIGSTPGRDDARSDPIRVGVRTASTSYRGRAPSQYAERGGAVVGKRQGRPAGRRRGA